jgi:hypothetical protein
MLSKKHIAEQQKEFLCVFPLTVASFFLYKSRNYSEKKFSELKRQFPSDSMGS